MPKCIYVVKYVSFSLALNMSDDRRRAITSRDLIIDDVRIASLHVYISSQSKVCDEFVTSSIWS